MDNLDHVPGIFDRNFIQEALDIVLNKAETPVERTHLFALYHHFKGQIEVLNAALEDDSHNRAAVAELRGRTA